MLRWVPRIELNQVADLGILLSATGLSKEGEGVGVEDQRLGTLTLHLPHTHRPTNQTKQQAGQAKQLFVSARLGALARS